MWNETMMKGDLVQTTKVLTFLHDVETDERKLEIPAWTTAVFLGSHRWKGPSFQQMSRRSIILVNGTVGWVYADDIKVVNETR